MRWGVLRGFQKADTRRSPCGEAREGSIHGQAARRRHGTQEGARAGACSSRFLLARVGYRGGPATWSEERWPCAGRRFRGALEVGGEGQSEVQEARRRSRRVLLPTRRKAKAHGDGAGVRRDRRVRLCAAGSDSARTGSLRRRHQRDGRALGEPPWQYPTARAHGRRGGGGAGPGAGCWNVGALQHHMMTLRRSGESRLAVWHGETNFVLRVHETPLRRLSRSCRRSTLAVAINAARLDRRRPPLLSSARPAPSGQVCAPFPIRGAAGLSGVPWPWPPSVGTSGRGLLSHPASCRPLCCVRRKRC